MAGLFDNVMGTLTGGLWGDTDQQRSSDRLWEASKFQPYNINTSIGTGSFDGLTGTATLNPRYRKMADRYRLFGNSMFNQLRGGSFNKLRDKQLGLLRRLARPDELRDTANMQTMLFNKGLLGATSGNLQMNALQDAQSQADLMRILESIGLAQTERSNLFDLGSRAYGADIALQGMPIDLLKLGADIGGTASNANYQAGSSRYEADTKAEKSEAGFLGTLFGGLF